MILSIGRPLLCSIEFSRFLVYLRLCFDIYSEKADKKRLNE